MTTTFRWHLTAIIINLATAFIFIRHHRLCIKRRLDKMKNILILTTNILKVTFRKKVSILYALYYCPCSEWLFQYSYMEEPRQETW